MHGSKNIISVITTILVVTFIIWFSLSITPVDNPDTARIKDFQSRTDEIDTIILGSSLARMGFNTIEYDKLTGFSSFNLGTSAQDIETTYITLKDIVLPRQKNIKQIYYLFDPVTIRGLSSEDSIHYIYSHVLDHKTKLQMFLSYVSIPENLFNTSSLQLLCEPYRTLISKARDFALPLDKLPENYKSLYLGKGVLKRRPDYSFFANHYFSLKKPRIDCEQPLFVNRVQFRFLEKMIDLCNKNNIRLSSESENVPTSHS
ncbi:MAG: hypothetical protein BKP49_06485 [Treponema sp. CETP13]|nr:MAG: hypothetical protein BKP49_06485 [Treponema sp. CETP13]